jgi:hypothetical protein
VGGKLRGKEKGKRKARGKGKGKARVEQQGTVDLVLGARGLVAGTTTLPLPLHLHPHLSSGSEGPAAHCHDCGT